MGGVVNAVSVFSRIVLEVGSVGPDGRSKLASVSQRLPSLQSVLDAFLRLLLAAQRLEGFAFQVEQILFAKGSSAREISAANDFGDLIAEFLFVVAYELALPHQMHAQLQGR